MLKECTSTSRSPNPWSRREPEQAPMTAEHVRLDEARDKAVPWKLWGPYLQGLGVRPSFKLNLKLGLTSRQEARERRIVGSLKPFRWNPAGNQSRPVEPDQQPEASLAWWVGDHPCEA